MYRTGAVFIKHLRKVKFSLVPQVLFYKVQKTIYEGLEFGLQPTIIFKICDVRWFCCNSVPKFPLNFRFSLRCFINMATGIRFFMKQSQLTL